ncbi:MAG: energy-coupling factor transporter transmembrane protein EcfT [Propionibacteriaceae bacterium]|jgi:energy-coupling factor transport system permease protein|nr:energy-coupling factor transporter transmembrane protein EcfT [Propionibacteriaceae bacterium]
MRPTKQITNQLDRLNPLTRLGLLLLIGLPILITLDWLSATVMLALELIAFWLAGTALPRLLASLAPVLLIGGIAALSMALYGRPGGQIYFSWWIISLSQQSLMMAVAVFLRMLALALAASQLLGRVDSTAMADALAQRAHLPARLVLGTLTGVRTIGLLQRDWQSLSLARRARGLGDVNRLRRFASMAFTLLVFAIRRASRLAVAMETRGLTADSAGKRSWARPSTVGQADALALLLGALASVMALGSAIVAGTFWLVWTGYPG